MTRPNRASDHDVTIVDTRSLRGGVAVIVKRYSSDPELQMEREVAWYPENLSDLAEDRMEETRRLLRDFG